MEQQNGGKGLSIASMVLGIVSVVLCCLWYVSLPCAILAIIFGVIGKKRDGRGMAIAGLVLGIIAVALYVLAVVGVVGIFNGLASYAGV